MAENRLHRGMTLAEIEKEILGTAVWIGTRHDQGHGKEGWFSPMHVGGYDAGPHSRLLHKFAKKGWVEMRWWGRARAYRITPDGIQEHERRKS